MWTFYSYVTLLFTLVAYDVACPQKTVYHCTAAVADDATSRAILDMRTELFCRLWTPVDLTATLNLIRHSTRWRRPHRLQTLLPPHPALLGFIHSLTQVYIIRFNSDTRSIWQKYRQEYKKNKRMKGTKTYAHKPGPLLPSYSFF